MDEPEEPTIDADLYERERVPDAEIPESDDPAVKKQLERAKKKFLQMDEDGNGVLNGDELTKLALWVFDSFHPDGEPLSEEQRKKEADKLLNRIDKNTDGVLEFDEFAGWFTKTCNGIANFRKNRS